MTTLQHVEIRQGDNGLALVVDDYELCDLFEDHLSEKGLEYEYRTEEFRDGRRCFVLHFATDVTREKLVASVAEIPASEIQRIWELNNRG